MKSNTKQIQQVEFVEKTSTIQTIPVREHGPLHGSVNVSVREWSLVLEIAGRHARMNEVWIDVHGGHSGLGLEGVRHVSRLLIATVHFCRPTRSGRR